MRYLAIIILFVGLNVVHATCTYTGYTLQNGAATDAGTTCVYAPCIHCMNTGAVGSSSPTHFCYDEVGENYNVEVTEIDSYSGTDSCNLPCANQVNGTWTALQCYKDLGYDVANPAVVQGSCSPHGMT